MGVDWPRPERAEREGAGLSGKNGLLNCHRQHRSRFIREDRIQAAIDLLITRPQTTFLVAQTGTTGKQYSFRAAGVCLKLDPDRRSVALLATSLPVGASGILNILEHHVHAMTFSDTRESRKSGGQISTKSVPPFGRKGVTPPEFGEYSMLWIDFCGANWKMRTPVIEEPGTDFYRGDMVKIARTEPRPEDSHFQPGGHPFVCGQQTFFQVNACVLEGIFVFDPLRAKA